jgi:hypothetical protein
MKRSRIGGRTARELPPMARRLKLEIIETAEYLEKSLKRARSGPQKERLQMLWWLKTGQVSEHQELSKRLGTQSRLYNAMVVSVSKQGIRVPFASKNCPRERKPRLGVKPWRNCKSVSSQRKDLAVMGRL